MENCNPKGFIQYCLKKITTDKPDTAWRAAMRRADNPVTAPGAWQYLIPFCRLSNKKERLAFSLVGSAIAREMPRENGKYNIGQALKFCTKNKETENSELARLRRLLACSDAMELIEVLRPVIKYIQSKNVSLNYEKLIWDILTWNNENTPIRWATGFFHPMDEKEKQLPSSL